MAARVWDMHLPFVSRECVASPSLASAQADSLPLTLPHSFSIRPCLPFPALRSPTPPFRTDPRSLSPPTRLLMCFFLHQPLFPCVVSSLCLYSPLLARALSPLSSPPFLCARLSILHISFLSRTHARAVPPRPPNYTCASTPHDAHAHASCRPHPLTHSYTPLHPYAAAPARLRARTLARLRAC
eukprot:2009336-Pleurochrysis_carterae.AAC.1